MLFIIQQCRDILPRSFLGLFQPAQKTRRRGAGGQTNYLPFISLPTDREIDVCQLAAPLDNNTYCADSLILLHARGLCPLLSTKIIIAFVLRSGVVHR